MNLRDHARWKPCMVRIPGVCNGNHETTVLAHFRMSGIRYDDGKPPDILGAWCCSACHTWVDTHKDNETQLWFAHGVVRTIAALVADRLVHW